MADLTQLTRVWIPGNYSPPRTARRIGCEEEVRTSVLQLGKAPRGKVFATSYKIDVKRYMTKRQVEMCEDGDEGTPPEQT